MPQTSPLILVGVQSFLTRRADNICDGPGEPVLIISSSLSSARPFCAPAPLNLMTEGGPRRLSFSASSLTNWRENEESLHLDCGHGSLRGYAPARARER